MSDDRFASITHNTETKKHTIGEFTKYPMLKACNLDGHKRTSS